MNSDLINDILSGQTNKFDTIIDHYYNELFVYVHNQVNNIETTKDLLQEIFMKIYTNLRKYQPKKASFRTWIYRITTNHCIDFHRKETVSMVEDVSMISSNEENMLDILIKQEDVSQVLSSMKIVLSKRHFNIMLLRFFSNLNNQDIATQYNISEKTVRNIISMSIKKIQQHLGVSEHNV